MAEQHRLEIEVDAADAESGLRRYERAINGAENATQRFERAASASFASIDQHMRLPGLSTLTRDISALNDNIKRIGQMSSGGLKDTARDANTAAAAVTKLNAAVSGLSGKSGSNLTALANGLERLSRARIDRELASTLTDLGRAIRALPAVNDGKILGLQYLAPALNGLASVRLPTALAPSLNALGEALRRLPAVSDGKIQGIGHLTTVLRRMQGLAMPTTLAPTLGALGKALQSLPNVSDGKIQGIGQLIPVLTRMQNLSFPTSLAPALSGLGTALRSLPAVGDGKILGLQYLVPILQRMQRLSFPPNLASALTGLGTALRSLPAVGDGRINGLGALAPILTRFSNIRIAPSLGQGLQALGQGIAAIPRIGASTAANLDVLVNALLRMPNVAKHAPGIVAVGQALHGFSLSGAPVTAFGRLMGMLAAANPAHLMAVGAALRQVAASGIGGMLGTGGKLNIRPLIQQGGNGSTFNNVTGGGRGGAGGNNGSGNGSGGGGISRIPSTQARAPRPQQSILPAPVAPTSALGMGAAVGVAGVAAGVKVASDSILEAGRAYERFRTQIMVTARAAGETDKEWSFVQQQADKLGLSLDALIGSYGKFSATVKQSGYSMEEVQTTFAGFAVGFKAMGMNSEQVKFSLKALEQMFSKGKVGAEELRQQLGDHMPGAVRLFADALGVSTAKLDEMMRKGEVGPDAVIKAGALAAKIYGNALSYSMNTADTAVQRFTNSLSRMKVSIWEGGFSEGVKGMFDKINEAMGSGAMQSQVTSLATGFKTLFNTIGDGAVWTIKHIEGVKLGFTVLFAAIAARTGLGMLSWLFSLGPMLGGIATKVITLGGSFTGLGAALSSGSLMTVFGVLVGGIAMFLAKAALVYVAFTTISGYIRDGIGAQVDWGKGLVTLGEQQYTFGQVAKATWQTASQYGTEAWAMIAAAADNAWGFIREKSAQGGGGVTGFFKQMLIDGVAAFNALFPVVGSGMSAIVDLIDGNGQGPIATAYRNAFNSAIDIVKASTSIISALIGDTFDRITGLGRGINEVVAGLATLNGDRAMAGAQAGSRAFLGLGGKTIGQRVTENNGDFQFGADHLRNAGQAARETIKNGAKSVEEASRKFESGVTDLVSPGGPMASGINAIFESIQQRFAQNLQGTGGAGADGSFGNGNAGSVGALSGSVGSRADQAFKYYMGRGLNPAQAAALVGNMMQESGLNPNANNYEKDSKGFSNSSGIMQWRRERLDGLKSYAQSLGKSWNDFEVQLDWALKEMNGPEARNSARFRNATTVADANAGLKSFIRYGDESLGVRGQNANQVLQRNQGYANSLNGPHQSPWSESQKANEKKVEQLSADRPIEKTPPKFEWEDLSYTQWEKMLPLMQKRLELTGKTKLEEADIVEILKQAGVNTKDIWAMEQERLASEKRLSEMSEKDREVAVEHQKRLNQFGREGLFVNQQQSDQLKGQLQSMADMAELKKEGAAWEQKFKTRREKSELTPSLNDWQRMAASGSQDGLSKSLKSATDSKDGVAMARAMKEMREKMYDSAEPYDRMIDALESEMKLTKMTNSERAVEQTLLEKKNELLKDGVILTGDQEAKMRGTIERLEKLKAGGTNGLASWIRSTEDFGVAIAKVEKEAIDGLIDKMADMVVTGQADFAALGQSILKEITKVVMNSLVKQFLGMFNLGGDANGGGIFGSIFGTGSGGGNMFSSLFGGGSGSSSGGNLFSGIGNMFSGITKVFGFKEGGDVTQPVNSYNVGMSAFSGAPHYAEGTENTSGGIPAILHRDEAVIPLSRGREVPVRLTGNDSNANDNGRTVTNNVTMHIVTPDAASFGKSSKQTKRDMSVGLQVAAARS